MARWIARIAGASLSTARAYRGGPCVADGCPQDASVRLAPATGASWGSARLGRRGG
ncbi:hypothetical protein [Geodermatophilus sp. SYSU D01176]